MYCEKCGKELIGAGVFCQSCGAAVPGGSAAFTPAPGNTAFMPAPGYYPPPTQNPLQRPVSGKDYLGIAVLAFLSLAAIVAIVTHRGGFTITNITRGIFPSFCIMGAVSMAAAVSARVKGPDFSIGSLMGVASTVIGVTYTASGSVLLGAIAAVLACVLLGLFNGALCSLCKIPALLVTVVTASAFRAIAYGATDLRGVAIQIGQVNPMIFPIVFFVIAIGIAVLVLISLGTNNLSKLHTVMGFGASGLLAALAGISVTMSATLAMPNVGSGYEVYILIAFSVILSSNRFLKGKLPAIGIGLFAALFIALAQNAMNLWPVISYVQMAIMSLAAIILLCTASAAHGGLRSVLFSREESEQR